jgi:hypothetical protein
MAKAKKKAKPKSQAEQSERFKRAAIEAGVDMSGRDFERGSVMLTSAWRAKNRAVVTVLQASRREADLTQRDLVERLPAWLGWDQTTLAKVETGRRRLDVVELMEIAKALKLEPLVLFTRIANWR